MGPSGKYDGGYINYTAGVAPASNPQVVLAIVVNHPTAGDHFGSSVMGAVLRHIISRRMRCRRSRRQGDGRERRSAQQCPLKALGVR